MADSRLLLEIITTSVDPHWAAFEPCKAACPDHDQVNMNQNQQHWPHNKQSQCQFRGITLVKKRAAKNRGSKV
jgi:hypothetical protein